MNNIRQITNFSSEISSAPTTYMSVYIGNKEYVTMEYYILSAAILTGSQNTPINKIGYICEPRGIDIPITITTGGVRRTINIGKTGMYEAMPEIFLNPNEDDDEKELDCIPEITEIRIPKGQLGQEDIKFKLDYSFAIN